MLAGLLTDERIQALLAMPKSVTNKGAREIREGKAFRLEYSAVAREADEQFAVFVRRHVEMEDNFTAGLRWHPKSGEPVILMRCNGSSHPHRNQIENTGFSLGYCHIHVATERYVNAGMNAEHFAEITAEYRTAKGALHTLCKLCNIYGLETGPDEPDLFPHEHRAI
jgi:hypothetical protein